MGVWERNRRPRRITQMMKREKKSKQREKKGKVKDDIRNTITHKMNKRK